MNISYHIAMFRRRYSKKARARIVCCVIVLFVLVVLSVRSVGGAVLKTLETKERLNDKNNELVQEKEKNKLLTNNLMKLEDPEYISQYIREDHYVIAEGEVFFLLPEEEVDDEATANN